MQTIDKEKLSEFTQELSEFQIEAAKTASTEVYDRYTIGKLEDHIVDLYQLSIDASHNGLQVLCGRMRDNIRNHLITGTNISNDEYVLMVEWKSLVKAYAVSCDNEKIVSALVINLSKSGWAYPLESKESEDFTAVLLDKKKPAQKTSNTSSIDNSTEIDSEQSDFEAVMQESSTSLADVFESIRSEEDEVEIESDDSLEIPLESGLGSLFDDEQSLADCFTEEIEAADVITEDVAAELDKPVAESIDGSASVAAEIDKEKIDDEVVENNIVADAKESIEAASDTDIIIDKVEISEESSSVIDESIASNIEETLFVAEDETESDDSEYKESFDEDLRVAEEAINQSNSSETSSDTDIIIDKIEISEEKPVSIDEVETKDVEAELFVEDESSEDSQDASYESEFEKDLESVKQPSVWNISSATNKEETRDVEAELFVEDESSENSQDASYESDFEKDLESVKQPSVWNISSATNKEETKDVEAELFVEDEGGEDSHDVSYEGEFEKDLESVKQPSVWNISSVANKEETKDVEAELFVEDEGGEDNHDISYEDEFEKDLESVTQTSVRDESKGIESASEVASPETVTELQKEEKTKPVKEDISGNSISTDKDVKESKSENTKNEKKEKRSRSIIEAYVDVIASKQKKEPENVPQELEQELIEEPPEEKQELESVEDILSRYSEWDESQKELLSLIISEVIEVINQQEEVLSVLDAVPVNKNAVREMLALYIEQIERIGSAAEMVGLDALQKMCELIDFHFGDLDKSSVEGIIDSKDRIKRWPYVVYGYLKDMHNQDSHKEVLDYISDDEWVRTIREDIKSELMEAFSNSTISIEKNEHDQRIKEATAEHVDVSIPDDVQAELLDGMLQELPRQTEEFSSSIQELVKDKYLEQLEVTQRIAHTIKGAANTVGIVGVATLTHHLEDILQALLKAESKPSENLHIALVDASDCLEQMSEFLLGQGEQPSDAVSVLQTILDWANYIDEFGPPHDDIESDENKSLTKNDSQSDSDKTADQEEKEKSKAAQDSSLRVSANMIDSLINQSGENIIAVSQMQENIKQLLMGMRDIKVNKDSVYVLSQHLEHLIDVQGASSKFSSSQDDEKFDPLELDQYNELHTYSRRLIEATADSVELVKELEDRLLSLESVISDQSRAQKDSQYAMLKTRMMPIESIVPRLKRGVRQAAKISGKSVELSVEGADMLVDIKILNNLIDPLMHLLRNAVDHGIEDETERKASNKPLIGSIKLTFLQTGERLEISCKDDGKGLDAQKIRQRAIEKNLLLNEDQQLDDGRNLSNYYATWIFHA